MAGRTPQSATPINREHATKVGVRNPQSSRLTGLLLDWFSVNARDLPWRRTRDPYAIWVSEIMLQQTQVKTVIPYWKRWMRELPTIEAVAKASPDKIHKLWEGLAYYTRVRNLQKAARQIVEKHNGKFPQDFDAVLALPGIGRYTAGAICSIAFNQPTPILDGNVIRVLTRVFGIAQNPRKKETNRLLWQIAEALVVHAKTQRSKATDEGARNSFRVFRNRAQTCEINSSLRENLRRTRQCWEIALQRTPSTKTFAGFAPLREGNSCSFLNQSLMELGALICTPRQPQCPDCPVKKFCVAFRENRVEELPNLGKRTRATVRRFMAFVVERQGRFLVRQRPTGVVNAHLWEFPNVEIGPRLSEPQRVRSQNGAWIIPATDSTRTCCGSGDPRSKAVADAAAQVLGLPPKELMPLCTVKHSITRYRITLEAWRVQFGGSNSARPQTFKMGRRGTPPSDAGGVWLTPAKLDSLALTSAHRKILERLNSKLTQPVSGDR